MFKWLWSEKGQYFYSSINHTIRADKNGNVFGGGDNDDDKEEAESGITGAGESVRQAGAMTPQEQAQYEASFATGEQARQLALAQAGLGPYPAGYITPEQQFQQQGPLSKALYGQVLSETQDPYAYYQSQLQPQLDLTQDYINRYYQGKGLIRSGMPIESMGRAGAELAVQTARESMASRASALARAAGLTEFTSGQQQQGLQNLTNIYGQQQQLGQNAMGRNLQGVSTAAGYQAYPYQAQLGSIYGQQAGNQVDIFGLGGLSLGALETVKQLQKNRLGTVEQLQKNQFGRSIQGGQGGQTINTSQFGQTWSPYA